MSGEINPFESPQTVGFVVNPDSGIVGFPPYASGRHSGENRHRLDPDGHDRRTLDCGCDYVFHQEIQKETQSINAAWSHGNFRPSYSFVMWTGAVLRAAGLLIGLGAAIAFLMWFHRAHRNLPALGNTKLKFTAGSAVGWWFFPILNCVLPYEAMQEIWKGSDPSNIWAPDRSQAVGPLLVLVWWGMYLLSNGWSRPPLYSLQRA